MQYPNITISVRQRQLRLYHAQNQYRIFPVAVGKPQTPTPIGTWQIQNKKILSDSGVFGTHWLGLSNPGYGIHGTNKPEFIGQAVSNGCIRMHNKDIVELFQAVPIGTTVYIVE